MTTLAPLLGPTDLANLATTRPDVRILDVRTLGEFEGIHIRGGKRRLSLERQVRIVAGALAATGGILGFTVHPAFALIPAGVGSGLVFAGVTDRCGMALVLSRLPYNRASCDVPAMVRALAAGRAPATT
ncbi:MAG: YgaP family membrane protein [Gemmatimonadaceae bacterium]